MVVQWLALLPHSKKVWGSNLVWNYTFFHVLELGHSYSIEWFIFANHYSGTTAPPFCRLHDYTLTLPSLFPHIPLSYPRLLTPHV